MAPVMIEIETRAAACDEIEFVDDLDTLSESNRCSCAASDDNPY